MRANVQGGMVSYQAHATACTDVWGKDPTTENPKASSTCANGEGGALARVPTSAFSFSKSSLDHSSASPGGQIDRQSFHLPLPPLSSEEEHSTLGRPNLS